MLNKQDPLIVTQTKLCSLLPIIHSTRNMNKQEKNKVYHTIHKQQRKTRQGKVDKIIRTN